MDKIIIERLRAHGIIGVYPHERDAPQDVLISATLFTDTHTVATSDRLKDGIDYDALAKKLQAHVESAARFTIEALAEDLASLCLQDTGVEKVILRVEKPDALPSARSVGVEVERTRASEE
jgi:FolB domain-containing protein